MGVWNTIAGTADHLAGSTDEAFARQFDDTAGGGFSAGFGEELGSSRTSFLTGLGQYAGLVPRGTAEQRQNAAGPGVQPGGTDLWGGGSVNPDGSTDPPDGGLGLGVTAALVGVFALVVLWLVRPLLEIGAEVADE